MSMPSFEESSRTRSSGRRKQIVFDLPSAEKTLPLLRQVLSEVVANNAQLSHLRRKGRRLADAKRLSWDRRRDTFRLQDDVAAVQHKQELAIEELHSLGVKMLDIAHGAVGFPTIVNGSLAYLVFQHEDDGIWYWRYRDQPKLRDIPECWYEQNPFAEEQSEGMLV